VEQDQSVGGDVALRGGLERGTKERGDSRFVLSWVVLGYKQAFCAIDIERIGPNASAGGRFGDCNSNQGISSGWADMYNSGLPCQYIVTVHDGAYTPQSTTNAKHVVSEDCFGDNTEWTGLRIAGNSVSEIAPPWIPEDRIAFNCANLSVAQFGGRSLVARLRLRARQCRGGAAFHSQAPLQ
jgi:hypothetical protein